MTVQPGYYRLSTLIMMMADVNRTDARALIPGVTINSLANDACADPIINCTSGTVTLSNEGDYGIPLSGYYVGGVLTPTGSVDAGNLYVDGVED